MVASAVSGVEFKVCAGPPLSDSLATPHHAKENMNLYEFWDTNYFPGSVCLIGCRDPLSMAVRAAQAPFTKDKKPSNWSHSFVFGDYRFDRSGYDKTIRLTPYLYESTINLGTILRPQLRNGAQENPVWHYANEGDIEHAAVIHFTLMPEQTKIILATGLQLVNEQMAYPVGGLFQIWTHILISKEWKPIPFNDPHAAVCSQYVRHLYQEAGADMIKNAGLNVDITMTTPEHWYYAGKMLGRVIFWSHL